MIQPYPRPVGHYIMATACAAFGIGALIALWFLLQNTELKPYLLGTLEGALSDAMLLLIALYALSSTLLLMWLGTRRHHLIEQRQRIARPEGALSLLALEQPQLSAPMPPLPVTVKMSARRWLRLVLWGIFAASVLLIGFGIFPGASFGGRCQFVSVAISIAYVLRGFLVGQWLEVSESGLRISHALGWLPVIPWEDIHLYSIIGYANNRPPARYEIATASVNLSWFWLRPGTFLARIYAPTVPYDDYNRQMETVLGIITARTSLPLYDLR